MINQCPPRFSQTIVCLQSNSNAVPSFCLPDKRKVKVVNAILPLRVTFTSLLGVSLRLAKPGATFFLKLSRYSSQPLYFRGATSKKARSASFAYIEETLSGLSVFQAE